MQFLKESIYRTNKRSWQVIIAMISSIILMNDGFAQIGGVVYKDFNSNGVRDNLNEIGMAHIAVEVTLRDGSVLNTNTGADGTYSFSAAQVPAGEDVRVRFPNLKGYYSGLKGSESKSSVMFTKGGDLSASLGIFSPSEYCEFDGPNILTSCYVNGDALGGGSAGDDIALVSFPYTASGLAGTTPDNQVEYVAKISETGSVWGMAYQISSKKFLVSALVRRHSGLGPLGTGGIYMADDINKVTVPFLDLQTLGINTGADNHTGLPADKLIPNEDSLIMHDAGRVGIGGMTFSEDEETLYVVNLYDRKLYAIEVGVPLNPSYPFRIVGTYDIPDPSGNGDHRPWALTTHLGNIYVGVVSSAEVSQDTSDLKGFIYQLNDETEVFEEKFSLDLTYPRGSSDRTEDCAEISTWRAWTDTFPQGCHKVFRTEYNKWVNFVMNPQPILSSITFDIDGSLILGFMDRFGLQVGYRNFRPQDDGELYDGFVGGDLLRAQYDPILETYELESGGVSGGVAGVGAGNGQGPGGGEFYGSDTWSFFGNPAHEEIFNGGVLLLSSTRELIVSAMDPVDEIYQSGGLRTISSEDGAFIRGFALYSDVPGTLGKSGGVGDFKLVCDPAPVELGNRVWLDYDQDGSQDPGEEGVAGLVVSIYDVDNGNTLVGRDTTDVEGVYCFNSSNVSGLNFRKNYKIQIGLDDAILEPLNIVGLSPQGVGSDDVDSDAYKAGDFACIDVNSGFPGEVKHTLDMGLIPCKIPVTQEALKDSSICFGTIDFDLPDAPSDGKWVFGQGPTSVEIDSTQGTITEFPIEGIYKFYLESKVNSFCKDSVSINVKSSPIAGIIDTLCFNENVYQLSGSPAGGTWSLFEPVTSTLQLDGSTGLVTNFIEVGDFTFVYDFVGCTDSVTITKLEEVEAGEDKAYCSYDEATQLNGLPVGGKWSASSANSSVVTLTESGLIAGFNGTGKFDFIYEVNNCTDTVSIIVIECELACIGDYAWYDANNNGIQDSIVDPLDGSIVGPELPASGMKIYVFKKNDSLPLDSVLTDDQGKYKFSDLLPGEYFLKFDDSSLPSQEFEVVSSNEGTDNSVDSDFESSAFTTELIALGVGESDLTWDLGLRRQGEPTITNPCVCNTEVVHLLDENILVSNYIFNERVEINATPGSVWRIIAEDQNAGTTTFGIKLKINGAHNPIPVNAVGMAFDVNPSNPGNYFFEFSHEEPLGYTIVVTDGVDTLTVTNSCTSIQEDYDDRLKDLCSFSEAFTLQTNFPTGTASYYLLQDSAFVFEENVDVETLILNAQPLTVFDAASFEPGSTLALYVKWEPNPTLETPSIKACEKTIFMNVKLSNSSENCLASVGDQVWIDVNKNGVFEIGEPVLDGVSVTLCDSLQNPVLLDGLGNSITSVLTDENGKYEFVDLKPGKYTLKFEKPAAYEFTIANNGNDETDSDVDNNGVTGIYTLNAGEKNLSVDVGYVPQGEIGDFVWFDVNDNGIQDTGEEGVEGVRLDLVRVGTDGIPLATVASTLTDSTGKYLFSNLQSGLYRVMLNQSMLPSQYVLSTKRNEGLDDEVDSDFDSVFGLSDIIEIDTEVAALSTNYSVDAGIIQICEKTCVPIIVTKSR